MECPYCNGKTKVNDTSHLDGCVYRRRECLNCGKSFYTEEYWIPEEEKDIAVVALSMKARRHKTKKLLKRINEIYQTV